MGKFKDFLDIPSHIIDKNILSIISSEYLYHFFNSDLLPIEYMRELYISDIDKFYATRDELLIRGFGFKEQYQNNFFPPGPYEINNLIVKNEDTQNYENINFSLIGLTNFVKRFNVVSDRFFNFMPLEGIQYLAKDFSLELIRQVFESAGFKIISINQEIIGTENEKITIPKVLKAKEYDSFVSYCNNLNIKSFSELSIDILKEFKNSYIVEANTYNDIVSFYIELNGESNNDYFIESAIQLLQRNAFKHLLDKHNLDYLEFLNDFYDNENFNYANNQFPIEKVQKLNKDIADDVTMKNDIFSVVILLGNNKFKDFLQGSTVDYLEFLNDVYNDNEFPIQSENDIQDYLIAKLKKSSEEAYARKITRFRKQIIEHENYRYISNFTLEDLKEEFELSGDYEDFHLELPLFELMELESFIPYYYQIHQILMRIKSPILLIKQILEGINDNQLNILKLRQLGFTLEEIGQEIGVTRERVRQIEANAKKRILSFLPYSRLSLYFNHYAEHDIALSNTEFAEKLGISEEKYMTILNVLIENESDLKYLQQLDKYIHTNIINKYSSKIEKIDFSQPIISFAELEYIFEDISSRSVQKIIDFLFFERGYITGKELYIREKTSLLPRIHYLFKNIIKEPLEMNNEGYEYFYSLMNEYFPIKYEGNKRAATARIADTPDIILVGGNTYLYHDQERISLEFITQLKEWVEEELEANPYADPRRIYKTYQAQMEQYHIISPHHLYSLVQIYLEDDFETGHRNSLYIFKDEKQKLSAESLLLNYLSEQPDGIASEEQILADLGWSNLKLDQLLGRINTAIMIGDKKVKLVKDYEFTDRELSIVKEFMDNQLEDGYVFTIDLIFEIFTNEEISIILNERDLVEEYSLTGFLKWLYPDLRGYSKLLYFKDSEIQTIEDALQYQYSDKITRSEIQHFVESKGYSEQMCYKLLRDFENNDKFLTYTRTEFINYKQIHFTEEVKESLKRYLDKYFEDRIYESVLNLVGFTQEILPISSSEWTYHLIYELATRVGYRQIPTTKDYRYNKLVLVKETTPIYNYEDLVYFVAKNEYTGKYHEESFAKYLVSKKLAHNPRSLTAEIFESPYFKFDNLGFFTLEDK